MRIKTAILITALASAVALAQNPQSDPLIMEPVYRFWNVRIGDLVMILAVLAAPFVALWVQWRLQLRHAARERKLGIFRTLMANRLTSWTPESVRALNMIDVEFGTQSQEDVAVRQTWTKLLDHFNVPRPGDADGGRGWDDKQKDLHAEILVKIGDTLGYNFDFTYYKTHAYYPQGHNEELLQNLAIRKLFLELMNGERALKTEVTNIPPRPFP
jgi:hypothetical protein